MPGREYFAAMLGDMSHVVRIDEDWSVNMNINHDVEMNDSLKSATFHKFWTESIPCDIFYSNLVTKWRALNYHRPSRCLSGNAATTQAGKSLTRCSRRKTKSRKRRRADVVDVEKIGKFV